MTLLIETRANMSKEIESAIEFEQNGPTQDEWCNLAPETELVRLECIAEIETRQCDDNDVQQNVPEYSAQSEAKTAITTMTEALLINPGLLRQMYQSLNQMQAAIFYTVRDW